MAHSAGLVGGMYASGIRGMPGGAAFTLTGVFVDRITPRLLTVTGAARAAARGMNAMTPQLAAIDQRMQMITRDIANQEKVLARYQSQMVKISTTESANYTKSIAKKRANVTALQEETTALEKNAAAHLMAAQAAFTNMESYMGITPVSKKPRKGLKKIPSETLMKYRLGAAAAGISTNLPMGAELYYTPYGIQRMKEVNALYAESVEAQNRLATSTSHLAGANRKLALAEFEADVQRQKTLGLARMQTEAQTARIEALYAEVAALEKAAAAEQYYANAKMYTIGAGQTALRSAGMAGALPYAAYGLGTFASMMVAAPYGKSLAQLQAIGGYTNTQTAALNATFQGMAGKYAVSQTGIAGGATVLSKAGIRDQTEMINTLQAGMMLSIINGNDLSEVLNDLITLTYQFNLERTKTLEIAANEQILMNASLIDFESYSEGMKYAAGVARTLGLTYQETGAYLAALNEAGLRGGLGGRNLRALMNQLAQDMEVINTRLEEGDTNLQKFFVDGRFDMVGFLEAIKTANPTLEDLQWYFKTFSTQGATALLYLTGMTDRIKELTGVQTGSITALEKAWETSQNNISDYLQRLKNQIFEVFTKQGVLSSLTEFAKKLGPGGALEPVIHMLGDFVKNSVKFMSGHGLKDLLGILMNFAKIFRGLMPAMQTFSKILGTLFNNQATAWLTLIIWRFTKLTSVIHQAVAALISMKLASQVNAGVPLGMVGMGRWAQLGRALNYGAVLPAAGYGLTGAGMGPNYLANGSSFAAAIKRGGGLFEGPATAVGTGTGMRRFGYMGGGMGAMGMGGVLGTVGVGAAIALIASYLIAKQIGDQKMAERDAALKEKYTVNINGPIYGFNDFDKAVRESNTYDYEDAKRYL